MRRLAAVGISTEPVCGARDYAALLAADLERSGVRCSLRWLSRNPGSARALARQTNTWISQLSDDLERDSPEAVLLHYSVFAFAYKGLPLIVPPVLKVLRRAEIPVITVLHELAYPWRRGGLRGAIWASTQRVALIDIVRSSAGLIVTTELRRDWLHERRWLADRPTAFAPVFSGLPAPARTSVIDQSDLGDGVVGVFGYSHESLAVALVLDGLRVARERGLDLRLLLLGAPGRTSAAGVRWLDGARVRGVEGAISFTGVLGAQSLSDALASCTALVFADEIGPSSRKTTLAASLASGRPVIALQGPQSWSELVDARAAAMVEQTPAALANEIERLLADDASRRALGQRGREFAEQRMSVSRVASAVIGQLGAIAPSR